MYETFLYITGPILLPISFAIKPRFMGMMTGIVMAMYFVIVNYFNEVSPPLGRVLIWRDRQDRTQWLTD